MASADVPLSVSFHGVKCLTCISERKNAENEGTKEEDLPEVRDAVTWAPSWVSQNIGLQQAMACVAVPSCYEHIGVREKTNAERAAAMGLELPGMS